MPEAPPAPVAAGEPTVSSPPFVATPAAPTSSLVPAVHTAAPIASAAAMVAVAARYLPPGDARAYVLVPEHGTRTFAGEPLPPVRGAADERGGGCDRLRPLLERFLNVPWSMPFLTGWRWPRRRGAPPPHSPAWVSSTAVELARGYAALDALPAACGAATAEHVSLPPLPAASRALGEPGFIAMRAAFARVQQRFGVRVVVHGSLASDDWTGYRDADLLLLLPDRLCRSADALQRLRTALQPALRALVRFDPLQHHGVFALPEVEVASWPEHWLPLAALRRARDLVGDGFSLACRPRLERAELLRDLWWIVQKVRRAWLDEVDPCNAYELKAVASLLMLLPALHLGARGQPCAKADSFARVESLLPEALREPLQWATALREAWHWQRRPSARLAAALPRLAPAIWRLPQRVRRELGASAADRQRRRWAAHALASALYRLAAEAPA